MSSAASHNTLRGTHALLICDMQPNLLAGIPTASRLTRTIRTVIHISAHLRFPLLLTTQAVTRFGHTVPAIQDAVAEAYSVPQDSSVGQPSEAALPIPTTFDKTRFSMLTPDVAAWLARNRVRSVTLVGIETHICVLQTALGSYLFPMI